MWHEGLLYKLFLFGFPRYIWIILHNWYRGFTSAVLWNSSTSCSFKISRGAILSPFLYSINVNDLLHQLSGSGYGATIEGTFCGNPMYANDLALLIATSSTDLQAMLEIVFLYSVQWRYQLNAQKSAIPACVSDPARFVSLILGSEWLDDNPCSMRVLNSFIISYLLALDFYPDSLHLRPHLGLLSFSGGYKEEEEEEEEVDRKVSTPVTKKQGEALG